MVIFQDRVAVLRLGSRCGNQHFLRIRCVVLLVFFSVHSRVAGLAQHDVAGTGLAAREERPVDGRRFHGGAFRCPRGRRRPNAFADVERARSRKQHVGFSRGVESSRDFVANFGGVLLEHEAGDEEDGLRGFLESFDALVDVCAVIIGSSAGVGACVAAAAVVGIVCRRWVEEASESIADLLA